MLQFLASQSQQVPLMPEAVTQPGARHGVERGCSCLRLRCLRAATTTRSSSTWQRRSTSLEDGPWTEWRRPRGGGCSGTRRGAVVLTNFPPRLRPIRSMLVSG